MDNGSWYVLQVLTGEERKIAGGLECLGFPTRVPRELRVIRRGGRWQRREYTLFPGYVFVRAELTPENWHLLISRPGVIRLLGAGGSPSPLLPAEAELIGCYGAEAIRPSRVALYPDGSFRVLDGLLLAMEERIVRIDRRRRRAVIRAQSHWWKNEYSLSIEILQTPADGAG